MKILMVTNTYSPHVGGVAQSVQSFSDEYRRRGHQVLTVAPTFKGFDDTEIDVIRIGAIENFNGTDFSLVLPPRFRLARIFDAFRPDIVHSHHPFLLGASAARLARSRGVPLVFTHHTLYERYTHYVPGNSEAMKRLAVRLSTRYANRSGAVFAPSQSVAEILRQRNVSVPIFVVPSGVPLIHFEAAHREEFRLRYDLPQDAVVVGHVGRLAPEKNLPFLAGAIVDFLSSTPSAFAVFVGDGPCRPAMAAKFSAAGVDERVRFVGTLRSSQLVDAYRGMDVFAFSSLSETQGLVLAEAMAAGLPVVAFDAPSVREIVRDHVNGRLVTTANEHDFAEALKWVVQRPAAEAAALGTAAKATAESYALSNVAIAAIATYERLIARRTRVPKSILGLTARVMKLLEGAVTLAIGGVLLLGNPYSLNSWVRSATADEIAEDPGDLLANSIRDTIADLIHGPIKFVAMFLVIHALLNAFAMAAPLIGKKWPYVAGLSMLVVFIAFTGRQLVLGGPWSLLALALSNLATSTLLMRQWHLRHFRTR
jgi:1,2-diacylglycerol 3-alpha-glucosyltransferase